MKVELSVRHTSMGGNRLLTIENISVANDDVRIGFDDRDGQSVIDIGHDDIPKLIAVLEAFAKVYPR